MPEPPEDENQSLPITSSPDQADSFLLDLDLDSSSQSQRDILDVLRQMPLFSPPPSPFRLSIMDLSYQNQPLARLLCQETPLWTNYSQEDIEFSWNTNETRALMSLEIRSCYIMKDERLTVLEIIKSHVIPKVRLTMLELNKNRVVIPEVRLTFLELIKSHIILELRGSCLTILEPTEKPESRLIPLFELVVDISFSTFQPKQERVTESAENAALILVTCRATSPFFHSNGSNISRPIILPDEFKDHQQSPGSIYLEFEVPMKNQSPTQMTIQSSEMLDDPNLQIMETETLDTGRNSNTSTMAKPRLQNSLLYDDIGGSSLAERSEDVENQNDQEELPKRVCHNNEVDIGDNPVMGQDSFPIRIGDKFASAKVFRDAILTVSIQLRREIYFSKSESGRIRAKCTSKGCKWSIFASYGEKKKEYTCCSRERYRGYSKHTDAKKRYCSSKNNFRKPYMPKVE